MSRTQKPFIAWLEKDYPEIEQRAQQEDAEIAWGDESGLRSDAQVGQGYAPNKHTPEIRLNTQRVSVNHVATISNQGKVRLQPKTDGTGVHSVSRAIDSITNVQGDVDCGQTIRCIGAAVYNSGLRTTLTKSRCTSHCLIPHS